MPELSPTVAEVFNTGSSPSVTLVRPGALGDTILTLPVLHYLRSRSPRAKITFCGSYWAEELMCMAGDLYSYFPFDSILMAPLFAELAPAQMPSPFRSADAIVIYTNCIGGHFVRNIRKGCGCPATVWDLTPPAGVHMALHMARAAAGAELSCEERLPLPSLRAPGPVVDALRRRFRLHEGVKAAVIHPGSGSASKNLPSRFFARIISCLREMGMRTVLLQGPADDAACRGVMQELPPAGQPEVLRGMSLVETAALLESCSLFIGNDSGVSHLAGALGVRTRVMFRSTDPAQWRPLGADVKVFALHCGENVSDIEKILQ